MKDAELLKRLDSLEAEMAGDDESAAMAAYMAFGRILTDHPHLRGKRKSKRVAVEATERATERRKAYEAYIGSSEWRTRREVAIRKAGGRCQVCNREGRLDVHHRTYIRFGAEMEDDLTVLCRTCHSLFSENGRLQTREAA